LAFGWAGEAGGAGLRLIVKLLVGLYVFFVDGADVA
jgi:hypothetical protein